MTLPPGKKITFAPQDGVDALHEEVTALLELLGHPEALVTDESHITDFLEFGLKGEAYEAEKERIWAEIEHRWEVDVRGKLSLLEIARAIAGQNRTRQ